MRRVAAILSSLTRVEEIARGAGIRDLPVLVEDFGPGNWLKLKGVARIEDDLGDVYRAEIHWYEAHGIGKRMMKVKRRL